MQRVLPFERFSLLVLAFAIALPLLAGCGGGGKEGTPADKDLMVTYFSHTNRTDVYRNQLLELRFTAPVKEESVSDRTIRFLTGANQATPADGALVVDGNRIYFDPTRTQETYDRDGPGATPDRPFGFEPLADYQLFIPGPDDAKKTLTNLAGKPIVKSHFASFRTSEEYVPELIRPEFVGVDGNGALGFIPEKFIEDDPGSPAYGEVVVAYNAQIVLVFSEPIAQASIDPGNTLRVRNLDVVDAGGNPVEVPGTVSPSLDGKTWTFTPSFHYGRGPYTISVQLKGDIADLAGNPLGNPQTIQFKTQWAPNVNTIGVLVESFDSNLKEDNLNTTGDWNGSEEGALLGGEITTTVVTVDYVPDNVNSRNANGDIPMIARQSGPSCFAWPNGARVQFSYSQADLGGGGAITEIAWGPDSNALFAANHDNIKIRLGHTNNEAGTIGATFDNNFKDGVPLPHYDGPYNLPQKADINGPDDATLAFWPYPKLTTPFDYNGQLGVVVDFQMDPADNCQTSRGWFWGLFANGPGSRQIAANTKYATVDTQSGGGQPWVFDMQFTKRRRITTAQSFYYDSAQPAPDWGEPVISPSAQQGGATYTVEWQGADGMLNQSGWWVPDPQTETPWSTNIGTVDGKRFIKFRFTLIANLNSDTVPRITRIQMPFQF